MSYDSKEKPHSLKESDAWVDIISGIDEEDLVTEDIINKLIADHERSIKDYRSEIKKSQRSIENLEYKKKKLKYGNNTIIFEPTILNWTNFIPDSDVKDAEHYYYDWAVRLIAKAKEFNISIRKALKLIDVVMG